MANTLNFVQTGDNSQLLASLAQSKAALEQVAAAADKTGQTIDGAISGFKRMAIGAATFTGLATGGISLVNQIKNIRTEFQNTEAMFKVFLKSGEAAESFMKRMQAYAFNNVFDLSRLSQSAAQLLAYGTDVDVVIDKLDNLSNIAAGTNKPLEELVGVYNKVKSTDIIDSRTEMSLKNMGINVRELLEQSRNLDKGSLSNATLRFQDLDAAIQAATHDGGLYEGMMEEKMKTLGDKVGLLQDKLQNTLNDIGADIQEPFGEVIENLADILEEIKEPLSAVVSAGVEGAKFITENWEAIVTILATVAAQYGTLKAAMAFDKAYDNSVRMAKHKAECKQLEILQQEYKKLRATQLQAEIAKSKSKGEDKTTEQLKSLNEKEQELLKLRAEISDAEMDNAISAKEKYDILNTAYAQYAAGLESYVNSSGALTAQIIKNSEDEQNAMDAELHKILEKDNALTADMQESFTLLDVAKEQKAASEEKIMSITSEMGAIQDLIKVKEEQGLDTSIEQTLLASKASELQTETTAHQAAVQEIANQRTIIYNAVEQSSTASTKANTMAKKANANAQKLATVQQNGATLAMKSATVWTYAQTVALKAKKLVINQVKIAWKSLKASLATNPMGWILIAIEGLISLGMWMAKLFGKKESPAEKQQKALEEAMAGAQAQAQSEQWSLDVLIKRMQAAGQGTAEYTKLRQQLINQYGKYGDFVRTETEDIVAQGEAYKQLKGYIENAAMARGKEAYMQDVQNEMNEGSKKVYAEIFDMSGEKFKIAKYGKDAYGQEYFNGMADVSEEESQRMQAHWQWFFENELPKLAKEGKELSAKEISDLYDATYNEKYGTNIKTWVTNSGHLNQDDIASQMSDWLEEHGEQYRQLYGDIWKIEGETKGEDAILPNVDLEKKKKAYLDAVEMMNNAYKAYSENATEENQKSYEAAKKEADNYYKQIQTMMGETDNTLTLRTATTEEIALQKEIVAAQQKINDARAGIVEGRKAESGEAEKVINETNAQLSLDKARLKVVQNTLKEIKENPYVTLRMDMSVDELAAKHDQNQKRLDEIAAQLKINPTVELSVEQTNLLNEQKEIEAAYKARTGITDQAWSEYKARKAALREEQNLRDSQLKSERQKIEATKQQALEQLKLDNAEYRRTHTGKSDPAYNKKRQNILLKAELDTKELERKYAEWKRNFQRQTLQIKIDMETATLQHRIDIETDVAKKIELQNKLFERQKELKKDEIELERDNYLKQQHGEDNFAGFAAFRSQEGNKDMLTRYANADEGGKKQIVTESGISADLMAVYAEMEDIFSQYEQRYQQSVLKMTQEKGFNDFNAEAERLQAFYDEVERINQEHNERVLQLQREGGTQAQFDQADEVRKQQLAQAEQKLGMNDQAELTERFTNFANDIAGLTFEEIKKQYTEFFDILQNDIKNVGKEVDVLRQYDSEEDMQQRANTIGQQLQSGVDEDGVQLTLDEKKALLEEQVLLEQTLADIKATEGGRAALLNQRELELTTLKKGQVKATQTYTNAITKAETKEQRAKRLLTQGLDATKEGLGAVKDATNAVANAFGGALSKQAKKALDTVSDIVDFAMQSIDGIKFVSENANKLMAATAEASAESISTVEKASVILTIISLAVQAIMTIIKIASKFTASAKMQEQIDEYKEQVEQIKKEQERLEKAYKREVGSDYYKGMAKAAEKYNEVQQKNNQAIAEAAKLYEYQKEKYGEDSDKAKDAKGQLDELKDAGEDYADSQKKIYDELAESLLGTNVTSFAEGLADSLVEAWQEGTSDMSEIWDTMLDDMKRDMMKKALSIALTDMFDDTFKRISALAKDGELNQSEIDQAIAEIDAKSAQAEAIAEQWRQAMEERGLLDDANPDADAGGFGSMSQDSADELNARFTALQMEGAAVVLATNAMQESVALMQANSDKSLLLIQDIDRFQQLAYEQSQEHIEIIRALSESVLAISKDTARLKAIEQNTNKL